MLERFVIATVAPNYHTNTIGLSKAAILEGWIINHTYLCKTLAVADLGRPLATCRPSSRRPYGRSPFRF
jgi:hypothetical protein